MVDELKYVHRFGTTRSYEYTLKIMKTFANEKDIKFNEVNYDFLKRFEKFHLAKESNSTNGLVTYTRTIIAIFKKDIKDGVIEKDTYPFSEYKIRTTPTMKRAINISYIKNIMELNLSVKHELFHAKNYFLISYMLYGMPFMDMAFLKINNIINDRIVYQKKTSKNYDIKISEPLSKILEFYLKDKTKLEFIFPIIKRNTSEQQYKDVIRKRKNYNKKLKKIAGLCGIEQRLTSYVSRHSFTTHAMYHNILLQAISAMLGRSNLNTTQIYLKLLPNGILDKYNERLSISL